MKLKSQDSLIKLYETLLERFGEPIGKQPALVGAADEGPGDKALWDDEPKLDHEWSDPNVVHESKSKRKNATIKKKTVKNDQK